LEEITASLLRAEEYFWDVDALYTGIATPLHAKHAQRGGRSVTVPILDSGARRGWVVSATPWPLYPRERDPVPIRYKQGSH